jgi:two-component system, NtrC family, sensor kinase
MTVPVILPTTRQATDPAMLRGRGLTRKFAAAVIVVVVAVFGIGAVVGYERERTQFDRALRAESLVLGNALARGMADVWEKNDEDAAYRFLGESSDERAHVAVRWVWVGEQPGSVHTPAVDISDLRDRTLIRKVDSTESLYTYVPVRVPGARRGALELRQSLSEQNAYLRESMRNNIIEAVMLAGLGSGLVFLLGVFFVGRPVARLVDKARRVGTGDLTGPLVLKQRDELGELATEMNRMCERLSSEQDNRAMMEAQLRHAERLTTVGKLASGLAHELGTPLNVVAGRARLLAEGDIDGDDVRSSARVVVDQAERMTKLIRQLLDFARPRPPNKTEQPLQAMAERAVTLLSPMAKAAGLAMSVSADSNANVAHPVDEAQMHQVMTNLMVNAIHATPKGGTVTIFVEEVVTARPADLGGGDARCSAITVQDTGKGMDYITRSRVFEPFFSTKGVGEGTGLGLSVSWGIVREHGGWIAVDASVDAGSAFTVYLPKEVVAVVPTMSSIPQSNSAVGGDQVDGDHVLDLMPQRPSGRALSTSAPPYAPIGQDPS